MKKLLLTLFIFSALHSFAQNPLVKMWDKRYGGTNYDELTCFQQTKDGGYILGGSSLSDISGNKTQALRGNYDYWIVKLDSLGIKQWDKDFGGTDYDNLNCLIQTTDGGYLLGGYSYSGVSGDKTQATWGNVDYWIVKTDSVGNKIWDKDFGGTEYDWLTSVQQTKGGGYILGGYSWSGINGDKSQPVWGGWYPDYWILKIDSIGNKEWDKDFGGSLGESLYSIEQTSDGGYILGGQSVSGVGGDKTQPNWTPGYIDYWIVKTDSIGNKLWDKDFGGTSDDPFRSLHQTSDGGFILGGWSTSGISGDKTQASQGGSGDADIWILKIDSLGNKQWDRDFGGTNTENYFGNIFRTFDGGYLLSGSSDSQSSGDKSENNLGVSQAWIVKTDSFGIKQWDKTVLTLPDGKTTPYVIQTMNGCYAVAKGSFGGVAGNKTEQNWDTTYSTTDFWIIKFCDSTSLLPSSALSSATPICPGTCTSFLNLSTLATTYQWSFPGATPDTSTATNPTNICYANSGSYDVQLVATNANGSDTLLLSNYITVYPSPAPQGISQSGDTLFANGGATTYQWYFNSAIVNGATNYFYVAPSSGDYNVVCIDANECEVEAAVFNVVASAQSAVFSPQSAEIHPNPVEDKLEITGAFLKDKKQIDISIYNLLGEKIFSAVDCRLWTVDCGLFPPGMYYLEVASSSKIFRTKFVKQ